MPAEAEGHEIGFFGSTVYTQLFSAAPRIQLLCKVHKSLDRYDAQFLHQFQAIKPIDRLSGVETALQREFLYFRADCLVTTTRVVS